MPPPPPPPPPPKRSSQRRDATREERAVEEAAASVQSSATLLITLVIVRIALGLGCAGAAGFFIYRAARAVDDRVEQEFGESRERIAKSGVKTLETAARAYHIWHEKYPPTLKVLTEPDDGRPPALEPAALIDPWGRPYQYGPKQRHPQTGVPLIYSQGADPDDPADDIRNW
jgi:Type II secretion system (T2SS), protein G